MDKSFFRHFRYIAYFKIKNQFYQGKNILKNILSVDAEEWFHPEALQDHFPPKSWLKQPQRVENNVDRLLQLFEEKQVTATFFVLGWVAKEYPKMIKKICDQGHEIASHGQNHRMITKLTSSEFMQDLSESMKILEEITGQQIIGFRAPTFSIVKNTLWAYEVMLDLGLKYDSSVYPIRHDRYGIPDAPRSQYIALEKNDKKLIEFPMPTLHVFGRNIPFGGGGYLRIFPLRFTMYAIKRFNREGFPAIIYMHPWEFDIAQPRLDLGFIQTKRHYFNIKRNYAKLEKIIDAFSWTNFKDYIANL